MQAQAQFHRRNRIEGTCIRAHHCGADDSVGGKISDVNAEYGARDPSHANSQIGILAVEQKLVEHVEAAHGKRRGGKYLHAAKDAPEKLSKAEIIARSSSKARKKLPPPIIERTLYRKPRR